MGLVTSDLFLLSTNQPSQPLAIILPTQPMTIQVKTSLVPLLGGNNPTIGYNPIMGPNLIIPNMGPTPIMS